MYLSPRVAGQLAIADAQGGPCDPRWPLDLSTFNFSDPAIIADPYPWYEQFRATQPVYRCELLGGAWLISRHEHIRRAFADRRLSSRRGGYSMRPLATRAPGLVQSLSDEFDRWLVFSDRPRHTDIRRSMSRHFPRELGQSWQDRTRDTVTAVLDACVGRGQVDFMADIAEPLTTAVICDFIGLDAGSRASVVGWSDRLNEIFGLGELSEPDLRCARASLDAFVDHLAGYPGTGLARWSACPMSTASGDLTPHDRFSQITMLAFAALEPSRHLLGNAVRELCTRPDVLAELDTAPQLWPTAVDELVRLQDPIHATARIASESFDFYGKPVARGDVLLLLTASGNRDPATVSNPEVLDLHREASPMDLSFGYGAHKCMGDRLVRAMSQIALREFFRRFPEAHLSDPHQRPDWNTNLGFRGLRRLPLTLLPAA